MERSLRVASSAAQPASKTSKPSTNPSGGASGSAAQPATLLEQVEQLGHYPNRLNKPTTDRERAEHALAMRISKQWSKLDDATKANLTHLQQPGHYPEPGKKPTTGEERAGMHRFISSAASSCGRPEQPAVATSSCSSAEQPSTSLRSAEQPASPSHLQIFIHLGCSALAVR